MEVNPFSCLLEMLPLYSEEDDLREEISELELVKHLPKPDGPGVVKCIRRMFEACGLLDDRLLGKDTWAFVSFPASLLGHSLLQILAVPDQDLFMDGYWRSSLIGDIEEQRDLLRGLEIRRKERHPTRSPTPIRYVYVAWGIIRLGNDFLLYHREDRSRPDAKNFGFPGGRFKPLDLPAEMRGVAVLRELHKSASRLAIGALSQTLNRELKEELKLPDEDWRATPREELKPFRKVEGARNAHGLTEYLIALYTISLTHDGEVRLLDRIDDEPENLVWFSIEDLIDPTGRPDGKRAFIDAFHAHFGEKAQLRRFLQSIPSSSTTECRFDRSESAVELPALPDKPILVGGTGKEKEWPVKLSSDEHALLLLVGAWGKGLEVEADQKHITLLPGGWVKVKSKMAKTTLAAIQARLVSSKLPLLQRAGEHFVRISVSPLHLFFGTDFFRYRLSPDGDQRGLVTVEFCLPHTVWTGGRTLPLAISVPGRMRDCLAAIASGTLGPTDLEPFGYSDDTMKKNCKEMLDAETRKIGLRKLVRLSGKSYFICATRMAA